MKTLLLFIIFPAILSILAWRRYRLWTLIGMFFLFLLTLFFEALVFIYGFRMESGPNLFAFIVLNATIGAYYFILFNMACTDEESVLRRLFSRAKPYLDACWERKWLWLGNVHCLSAVVASSVLYVMAEAMTYWQWPTFSDVLRRFPIRTYTPGRRFFAIVLDFLNTMRYTVEDIPYDILTEIRYLEWR